jgi:fucose permease
MAAIFPTTVTLAGTWMPITGRVTGWFFVGSSLGGMTIPWLIGQLFEPVGPQAVPLVVACAILLSIGVFLTMAGRARTLAVQAAGIGGVPSEQRSEPR